MIPGVTAQQPGGTSHTSFNIAVAQSQQILAGHSKRAPINLVESQSVTLQRGQRHAKAVSVSIAELITTSRTVPKLKTLIPVVGQAVSIVATRLRSAAGLIGQAEQISLTAVPSATNVVITAAGAGSYVVPAKAYQMTMEAWGGGGGASGSSTIGGSGGGGGYSRATIQVTPGTTIFYTVGGGGAGSTGTAGNGGVSWVNPSANSQPSSNGVVAAGGTAATSAGGIGSGGSGSVGTANFTGGSGCGVGGGIGSGGGGGAGSAGNGVTPTPASATGGAGGTPDGGAGGNGITTGTGGSGHQPGGAGGGSWNNAGGPGAAGMVKLRFTSEKSISISQAQGITVVAPGAAAAAFLARTSGLNAVHQSAYANLINGLVLDGLWSKLDVLYIFATQDSTTALLNLVSSSFGGVTHGSPAFVADRGFTGVDSSTTVYIDTQFNPTTGSPQFATNSCHASAWATTGVTSGTNGGVLIGSFGTGVNNTSVYGRFNDGNAYFRINDTTPSSGFTSGSSVGHWIASRTGASTSVGYQNGTVFGTPNKAAGTLVNQNVYVLAANNTGAVFGGTAAQVAMASIGSGLTGTDATNFYNRLRAYMTAVGVP